MFSKGDYVSFKKVPGVFYVSDIADDVDLSVVKGRNDRSHIVSEKTYAIRNVLDRQVVKSQRAFGFELTPLLGWGRSHTPTLPKPYSVKKGARIMLKFFKSLHF